MRIDPRAIPKVERGLWCSREHSKLGPFSRPGERVKDIHEKSLLLKVEKLRHHPDKIFLTPVMHLVRSSSAPDLVQYSDVVMKIGSLR